VSILLETLKSNKAERVIKPWESRIEIMMIGLEIKALKELLTDWIETFTRGLQRAFMPELREIRLFSVSEEECCRLFLDKGSGGKCRHSQ